jgi:hypothetical protein
MKIEVTITIEGNETATQIAFAKFLEEAAWRKVASDREEPKQEKAAAPNFYGNIEPKPLPTTEDPKATAPAADLAPEKPLKVKKEKAVAPVKEDAPEPFAELSQSKAPEPEEAPALSIVTLRKMVSERAAAHRGAMREKLTELGAENVSSLPEEKYTEFHNFLLTLD